MEQWRRVEGYPDYEVSNYGRVRSDRRQNKPRHLLSKARVKGRSGKGRTYEMVGLKNRKGVRKHQYVHRLVAAAFCQKPKLWKDNKTWVVNHKNNDSLDNHAKNLHWVTRQTNNSWCPSCGKSWITGKPSPSHNFVPH